MSLGKWLGGVLLVVLLGTATAAGAAPLMLSDLESEADFGAWMPDGFISNCPDPCTEQPATLTRVAAHATEGGYSLQVEATPGEHMGMDRFAFVTNDWSAYNTLLFDVENPTTSALSLHIEISDLVHGGGWANRALADFALVPGVNHIRMSMVNVPINPEGSGGYLDTSQIANFSVGVSGQTGPLTYYFDNMRLDSIQDDPEAEAARGIWQFDFGPGDARWTNFFAVGAGTTYPESVTRPFGWTDGNGRYAADYGGPDDLCRDMVRPAPCCPDDAAATITFRLDVPNGTYHVWVIARSGNLSEMPVLPYRVKAEGITAVDVPISSSNFYTADYFWRGLHEDYPLSAPAWDLFENTNFPVYQFTTTVSDGHLDVDFVHAWVYAMVVYPDTPSLVTEMTARLADLETARRAQFSSSFYINDPPALTFTPTAEETARGYAAWPASLMSPCYPDTLPPDTRPTLALSAVMSWDERRQVSVAIRPPADLTGVSLAVTDLSDGAGHTIPAAEIETHYLRYLATGDSEFFGSGVLSWKPRLLQRDFPIAVPAQVTKQLVLNVHVPSGTPAGTYTGTVTVHADSGDVAVPLSVQVYPFLLDNANDAAYGWYYNPPESQYSIDTRFFTNLTAWPDALLRQDFALMKKYGFNGVTFPTPSISVDGSGHVTSFDASALERYVTAARETGFGGDWMGQVGTSGFDYAIPFTRFSPEYGVAFKEALGQLVDWGSAANGTPLVFYLTDEPRESGLNSWNVNFADAMQYVDLAKQVPGAVNTITVMSDSGGTVDYTPFADALDIMQTHPWPNSSGLIQGAYSQSKPNWFYNTGGDLRMVYGFYQQKYGGHNGAWEWHYDWLDGDMFDTFPYSPFNNHWRYVYPSPDGPVPTLNFLLASQGIWDYRYVKTLIRMAAEAQASGDPDLMAWADQAQALVGSIAADTPTYAIDTGYRAQHFGGTSTAADAEAAMEGSRLQIAALIASIPTPIPGQEADATAALPASLEWETSGTGSATIQNLTTGTWAAGYGLRATGDVNRWGVLWQPLSGTVAPSDATVFPLSLTAPPVTTLSYPLGATATDPPVVDDLRLYLGMANGTTPLAGGTPTEGIVISRFPDIQPGTDGAWARSQVEECAGRVPYIVKGFADGSYRPRDPIRRDQMALFLQRSLKLPLGTYQGLFTDVPESDNAALAIEACVAAGVVTGYQADNTYRGDRPVLRDQMAVFLTRGLVGGEDKVPIYTGTPSFTDVFPGAFGYDHIEYAVAHGVAKGYSVDNTYRPKESVKRDQMATFIYRAFVAPTASLVVLAGPAVTAQDPATGGACGWASVSSGPVSDPGYAYVTFDAMRLGAEVATGGTWEVTFELRNALTPDTPAVDPYRFSRSLTPTEIAAAKSVAQASGDPYRTLAWDIPAGLAAGNYVLVVSAEDQTGAMNEVLRRVAVQLVP